MSLEKVGTGLTGSAASLIRRLRKIQEGERSEDERLFGCSQGINDQVQSLEIQLTPRLKRAALGIDTLFTKSRHGSAKTRIATLGNKKHH